MDYKKAFEKLVEQIETESKWASEELSFADASGDKDRVRYDRGMCFAYRSIAELALMLKNDEFDFEEKEES